MVVKYLRYVARHNILRGIIGFKISELFHYVISDLGNKKEKMRV